MDVGCALSAPLELSIGVLLLLLALVLLLLAVVSLLAESSRLESLLGGLMVESLLELLAGVAELLLLGLEELLFKGVELLLEEVVVDEEEDEVEVDALSAGEAEVTGLLVEGVDDEALLG